MREAILLKPLDGHPAGSRREFSNADFDTLKAMGAVRLVNDEDDLAVKDPHGLDVLRKAHSAELDGMRQRAEAAEDDLSSTREALGASNTKLEEIMGELKVARTTIADLTSALEANAATQTAGDDTAAVEQTTTGAASEKMEQAPQNKAAPAPKNKSGNAA